MNLLSRYLLEAHRADLLILDHRGTRVAAARRATRARRTSGPEDDSAADVLRSILIVCGVPGLADRVVTPPTPTPTPTPNRGPRPRPRPRPLAPVSALASEPTVTTR